MNYKVMRRYIYRYTLKTTKSMISLLLFNYLLFDLFFCGYFPLNFIIVFEFLIINQSFGCFFHFHFHFHFNDNKYLRFINIQKIKQQLI
jgi:hypothetical protein